MFHNASCKKDINLAKHLDLVHGQECQAFVEIFYDMAKKSCFESTCNMARKVESCGKGGHESIALVMIATLFHAVVIGRRPSEGTLFFPFFVVGTIRIKIFHFLI